MYLRIYLRIQGFVRVMAENASRVFPSAMTIYRNIPAEGVLRVFCRIQSAPILRHLSLLICICHHIPRPFGLGDPAGLRSSGGLNRAEDMLGTGVVECQASYLPPPVDTMRSLLNV